MANDFIISPEGVAYAWQQLAFRAGILETLVEDENLDCFNFKLCYDISQKQQANDQFTIFVQPANEQIWYHLLNCPPNSLDWLPVKDAIPFNSPSPLIEENIPVLFWSAGYEDGHKPFAERRDNCTVIFYVDIVATAYFMLSRWEETLIEERDEHDRFPATASVAYKQSFLDRPIVDEYALILREWIKVLLPHWQPEPRRFAVKLSHDIDYLARFSNIKAGLRVLGGDLIKRRSISHARQTIADIWQQSSNPAQTPQMQGIRKLACFSEKYNLQSAFYFMAAEPSLYDSGYDLASPVVKRCIDDLLKQGHEIGFHPSYCTFDNPDQLALEKARFDRALGLTEYGGRQHVLRFKVADTWHHWEQMDLIYDSTLAFADHEGFRCGTCHPFFPFSLKENRELKLLEVPLIVMDTTLRFYRKMTPSEAEVKILHLARRCKQVNGVFTLLWHNSSLSGEWQLWEIVYYKVINELAKMQEVESSDQSSVILE